MSFSILNIPLSLKLNGFSHLNHSILHPFLIMNFSDKNLTDKQKLLLWEDLLREQTHTQTLYTKLLAKETEYMDEIGGLLDEVADLKNRLDETSETADQLFIQHGGKCMWLQKRFNADCHIPGFHNNDADIDHCLCSKCAPGVTDRTK